MTGPESAKAAGGGIAGIEPSLAEVNRSVLIPKTPSFWRRLFAFAGPAYLVSVGYMDPGNWATDIAAGSKFGYALIWVLLMSNAMAILLQSLSARIGIVARLDLAQACRAMFPRPVAVALWILAEVAIAACDLAEVLGSAIGLKLLFGIPLLYGVLLTTFDTLLLLVLHQRGMRLMEAFIVSLVATIGACLLLEIVISRPDASRIAAGVIPSLPGPDALYLAIGILGATVMPHNLYLHSALVQSRSISKTPGGIRNGIKFNTIDSVVALNAALFVNAALLIMAAATFHRSGFTGVAEIEEAHHLLEPILGASIAPIAFAIALLAAGQSSTITGTLAGQIVMEGFVNIRIRPVIRRLLTRGVAIVPAAVTIIAAGDQAVGRLLILSQVILSLQLSFAVIPLVHLASDRRWMGQYRIRPALQVLAWAAACLIVGLNVMLVFDVIGEWTGSTGGRAFAVWAFVVPGAAALIGLLVYVAVVPFVQRVRGAPVPVALGVHGLAAVPPMAEPQPVKCIAVAIDFSDSDGAALSHALGLARQCRTRPKMVLLHVVESGGVGLVGGEILDSETVSDQKRLEQYTQEIEEHGAEAAYDLGFGHPDDELAALVSRHGADLLVMGSHGHRGMADVVWGTTINKLRHRLGIPVLIAPAPAAADKPGSPIVDRTI